MKRYIITLLLLLTTAHAMPQSNIKSFIGLKTDSIYSDKLNLQSTSARKAIQKQTTIQTRLYHDRIHPHIPTVHSIDQSRDVGEISIETSTNPMGAFIANVPIEIHNVPSGFQPSISITYNSQAANGNLGVGWNIGGISVISKVNKSIYHDLTTKGIEYDANKSYESAYALDGIRLIQVNRGNNQITYQTEQNNIRVVAYLEDVAERVRQNLISIYYIITKFDVFYPNGTKAIYELEGNVNNKYDKSSQAQLNYYITKQTDNIGNIVEYNYNYENGNCSIKEIKYGRNLSASVIFYYENSRPDKLSYFYAGKEIQVKDRLTGISTHINNTLLKSYSISYKMIGHQSVISEINCNAEGNSLNPLKFYYGDGKQKENFQTAETQLMNWYNFKEKYQIRVTKGKFDYGSENDGIISFPNKIHYKEHKRTPGRHRRSRSYFENDYDGNEDIIIATGLGGKFGMYNPKIKTGGGFVDLFCADLDDFSGEEIIKVNNYEHYGSDRIEFNV